MTRKKGTGRCRTCSSRDRGAIEELIARGNTYRKVAKQFDLTHDAVRRHWINHVTPAAKERFALAGISDAKIDPEQLKQAETDNILPDLLNERGRLRRIADLCEANKNYSDAIRASASIVKVIETIAKLLGQLTAGRTTIQQNFLMTPDYFEFRNLLSTSLRRHPAAMRDVLGAIARFETSHNVEVSTARAIELERPTKPENP